MMFNIKVEHPSTKEMKQGPGDLTFTQKGACLFVFVCGACADDWLEGSKKSDFVNFVFVFSQKNRREPLFCSTFYHLVEAVRILETVFSG